MCFKTPDVFPGKAFFILEDIIMPNDKYTSIVKLDFQYAHRFMNWPREAKHLHGHSGLLTIELEDTVDLVIGICARV